MNSNRFHSLRRFSRRCLLVAAAGTLWTRHAAAQSPSTQDSATQDSATQDPATQGSAANGRLTYGNPRTSRWKVGLELETPVTCTNIRATFPVPVDWPEQTVKVVNQTVDPRVSGWKVREIAAGAKQVVLQIPQVAAGTKAELTLELEIARSSILPPQKTDDLVIPKRVPRELQQFMGVSPHIDLSNSRIKKASREIAQMDATSDWDRIEKIYDYVRDKVQYVEGDLKNASQALQDGTGDCEELTSLFIALCRNARVPARMVWIPGHCYPEFFLEDASGEGYWFPCQAAGTRQFGRMDEYRPVLQKGDRFKVPEKRTMVRYVAEHFQCDRRGKGNPRPNFIRKQLDV